MNSQIEIPRGQGEKRRLMMTRFAKGLIDLCNRAGFKISSRGWCYQLEGLRVINKNQFNRIENLINECRKSGYLPIDFVAEETARQFSGVEKPETLTPEQYLKMLLNHALKCEQTYIPNWWKGEEYYTQLIVEKIDLKTLFEPVCREYHIPIATTKGWSSMNQRAEYARRFKEAEEDGLTCVLLYCGDHDPDGLRISDFLRSNLYDLAYARWNDGTKGYSPSKLIIERFGLDYSFIMENNLTWIDNLITGSGKDLSSPLHPNHEMEYVQEYLSKYGARKCEANALVVNPISARNLCRRAIEKYLGAGALERFQEKKDVISQSLEDFRERTGLSETIQDAIDTIDEMKED